MTNTTATALTLIKTIAALDFRPMDSNDFAVFAGADRDAQIAFAGHEMTEALVAHFGDALIDEEGFNVAVVVSGDRVEIVTCGPDGEDASYSLDLARL